MGSGDALARRELAPARRSGRSRLRVELWHAQLARPAGRGSRSSSDGVTNFVAERAIPDLLAAAPSDLEAARALAQAAFAGGAGDNVAVAVFAGRAGV